MKLKLIASLSFAILAFSACDDTTDELGSSLTGNMDQLEISTDIFDIQTNTIVSNAVLARTTTGYLGKVRDPETGAYITADFMTQFHTLDEYTFPDMDRILSKEDGLIVADSCEIRLYYTSFYGDSLATMKLTACEMAIPMSENTVYYSDYNPESLLRTDENAIRKGKTYTLTNMDDSDADRASTNYSPNIRINLNDPYVKDGVEYSNYGTYIMQQYYKHPEYFKNSYTFIKNVVPGFYFKLQSGLGSMAYIYVSQLNVYFRYTNDDGESTTGTASFAGTEEVLQATHITNDTEALETLKSDQTCTYLKTPAGLFTELVLPVAQITANHDNDSINTAKVIIPRINNTTDSKYALDIPQTLLMIPKDSLQSFFEHKSVANYKTSFLATYNSSNNSYTFSNIGGMVKEMASQKQKGETSEDWNHAVLVPVVTSYNSSGELTKVTHDMSLTSTKLVGGSLNPNSPIQISVIYSKFK